MADVAPVPPPAPRATMGGAMGTVLRMVAMYMVMSYLRPTAKAPGAGGLAVTMSKSLPKFQKGYLLDMYVFLSEQQAMRHYDMSELIWSETGIELGNTKEKRSYTVKYEPSKAVQTNGSLFLHVVFAKPKKPINPGDPGYDEGVLFTGVHKLTKYMAKPKNDTGVNLLSQDALPTKDMVYNKTVDIISFFKPNVTIQLVDHFVTYASRHAIPEQIRQSLQFDEYDHHYPIIYFNEFWLLRDKMLPMNKTVDSVDLFLDVGPVSMWWWQLLSSMEKSFSTQQGWGMQQEGESDELKRVLLEGNPILLAVTFVVSMLHTVFDLLAFKNDIGFWKANKSMEGLSAKTVLINAVCQLVILGYLFDNDTSFVVLLSATLGTGIEIWKVSKAFKMSIDRTKFPYIKLEDRLSVFRDDLVFLVYIYQRWIYRVDLTRTNEFGFSGEEPKPEEGAVPAIEASVERSAAPAPELSEGEAEPSTPRRASARVNKGKKGAAAAAATTPVPAAAENKKGK
ncbi:MAG: hypothetical protein WDW38_010117 [Sanguina aurantia]